MFFLSLDVATVPLISLPLWRVIRRYQSNRTGRPIPRTTFNRWRKELGLPVGRHTNQHADQSWIGIDDVALLDAWYWLTWSKSGPQMSANEFIDRFLGYDPEETPQQKIDDYLKLHANSSLQKICESISSRSK